MQKYGRKSRRIRPVRQLWRRHTPCPRTVPWGSQVEAGCTPAVPRCQMRCGGDLGADQRAIRIKGVRSTDQREVMEETHRSELGAVVKWRLRREAQLRRKAATDRRARGSGIERGRRELGRRDVVVRDERGCVRYRVARATALVHDQEEDEDEDECG